MQAGSANRELLDLLVAFLPQRFPGHFQLDGTRLTNAATGDTWDLADDSADPLDVAAQLVQVSLCAPPAKPASAPSARSRLSKVKRLFILPSKPPPLLHRRAHEP